MAPERGPLSTRGETTASWAALGTGVTLRVSDPAKLDAARAATTRELDLVDRACSRFREDSELAALNVAGGRPAPAGDLLIEALQLALRAAALTDGDVDPTVGVALELAGYDRDFSLLAAPAAEPEPVATITIRRRPGWRAVRVDRRRRTVTMPAGVRLDLGATAKAWAADRAAAAAAACGCGALVGLGGDIALAGSAPPDGWRVHVTDDHRSHWTAPGQTVSIRSGGLATSSTAVRRWSHAGRTMHHIIDPATGTPAQGPWRTVSVAAGTCADANIAATAAILRGAEAPAWLASMGLPARLVALDGNVKTVGDWPADEPAAVAT